MIRNLLLIILILILAPSVYSDVYFNATFSQADGPILATPETGPGNWTEASDNTFENKYNTLYLSDIGGGNPYAWVGANVSPINTSRLGMFNWSWNVTSSSGMSHEFKIDKDSSLASSANNQIIRIRWDATGGLWVGDTNTYIWNTTTGYYEVSVQDINWTTGSAKVLVNGVDSGVDSIEFAPPTDDMYIMTYSGGTSQVQSYIDDIVLMDMPYYDVTPEGVDCTGLENTTIGYGTAYQFGIQCTSASGIDNFTLDCNDDLLDYTNTSVTASPYDYTDIVNLLEGNTSCNVSSCNSVGCFEGRMDVSRNFIVAPSCTATPDVNILYNATYNISINCTTPSNISDFDIDCDDDTLDYNDAGLRETFNYNDTLSISEGVTTCTLNVTSGADGEDENYTDVYTITRETIQNTSCTYQENRTYLLGAVANFDVSCYNPYGIQHISYICPDRYNITNNTFKFNHTFNVNFTIDNESILCFLNVSNITENISFDFLYEGITPVDVDPIGFLTEQTCILDEDLAYVIGFFAMLTLLFVMVPFNELYIRNVYFGMAVGFSIMIMSIFFTSCSYDFLSP